MSHRPPAVPAHNIPLPAEQLKLLGELVVIVGQIDDGLALMLTGALKLDRPTVNVMMRSQDAIDLWKRIMLQRFDTAPLPRLIELAASEIKGLSTQRNDFIHADYRAAFKFQGDWVTVRNSVGTFENPQSAVIASRHRDQRRKNTIELHTVRDRAARTSCLVAHIGYLVAPHGQDGPSPWWPHIKHLLTPEELAADAPRHDRPAGPVTRFDNVRPTVPGDD